MLWHRRRRSTGAPNCLIGPIGLPVLREVPPPAFLEIEVLFMSQIPTAQTFKDAYADVAPWDIGRIQNAFASIADVSPRTLLASTRSAEGG